MKKKPYLKKINIKIFKKIVRFNVSLVNPIYPIESLHFPYLFSIFTKQLLSYNIAFFDFFMWCSQSVIVVNIIFTLLRSSKYRHFLFNFNYVIKI